MRIAFGDLPLGARFEVERVSIFGTRGSVCVKVGDRRYREQGSGALYDKSPGVYVDCIESELRLAVLRARQGNDNG